MGGKKQILKKAAAHRRKMVATPKQNAKDARMWACGRKKYFPTQEAAQLVADVMGHAVYPCSYCKGFHTAHLPGSRRFLRGKAA